MPWAERAGEGRKEKGAGTENGAPLERAEAARARPTRSSFRPCSLGPTLIFATFAVLVLNGSPQASTACSKAGGFSDEELKAIDAACAVG